MRTYIMHAYHTYLFAYAYTLGHLLLCLFSLLAKMHCFVSLHLGI